MPIDRLTFSALVYAIALTSGFARPAPRLHNLAPSGDLATEFVVAAHRTPGLPPVVARHSLARDPKGEWESRVRLAGTRTSALLVGGKVVAWRRLDGQEVVFELGTRNALVRRATLTDESTLRIAASDGWISQYRNGELTSLESPDGTIFSTQALGACVLELRHPERGPIYTATYSADGVLRSFVLEGTRFDLEFEPSGDRLLRATRGNLQIIAVTYQDRLCRHIDFHETKPLALTWRKRGPFELFPIGYLLRSDGAHHYALRATPAGIELSATDSASGATERLFVPRRLEAR